MAFAFPCPCCGKPMVDGSSTIDASLTCSSCGAPPTTSTSTAMSEGVPLALPVGTTAQSGVNSPFDAPHVEPPREEPDNPFDFSDLSSFPVDSLPNEFQLDKEPVKVWGNVRRGLGLIALAAIVGPALVLFGAAVALLILIVGAVGLITVEDLNNWLIPGILVILWFVPCLMAIIRATGAGYCLAAPSRRGMKGLVVALVGLILVGGTAACLALVAQILSWPRLRDIAIFSLVPYFVLSLIDLGVSTLFLLQLGKDLHSISFVDRVGRFGAWFAYSFGFNLLLTLATEWYQGSPYVVLFVFPLAFLGYLGWFLFLVSDARSILTRVYHLNAHRA
jgi:hypothetical protein